MLKKILYNHAKTKFQTNHTTNHTTGNKTHKIEFILPSSDPVSHHIAVNVANNRAATQIHTTTQINIFPKNDQSVTSLGALSNIFTSGFLMSFFCIESIQIWELPIGGISKFLDSVIVWELNK